ncbi:hypothetical protein [Paraburkholderia saeva]|uniref:hypothetical protein n=1 Tax=Paraburkholderia saeva TaxID=2777537 RepID=UPI001DA02ECE|nr:hypothetical protein [Paraburkholderia saeva]CAG4893279.1 hypothetical protein R70241_01538 [Paraburkholderia saeva]
MQYSNTVNGAGGIGGATQGSQLGSPATGASSNKPSFQELLSELTGYIKGTPSQQMEKQILAKLGITEKDLKAMTPEQRAKVMEQVREMVKRELAALKETQKAKKTTGIDAMA